MQLPVTEQQFLDILNEINKIYPDIDSKQKIAASLAMAVAFLPKEQSVADINFLADCVRKACSTHLCKFMAEKIGHEASVDMLVNDILNTANPQSIDQLTQAAHSGSEYAKAALAKLELPAQSLSVVSNTTTS